MNITIIDRSELTSMRLASLLSNVKGIKNIIQVIDKAKIMDMLNKVNPDVIIFDININGSDSMKLLKEIKKYYPGVLIIILTSFSIEQYRKKCREMSIESCLDKTSEFDQIPKIISNFFKLKSNNNKTHGTIG
jgi:DNA-binding NarL/FixJ family response regulator